MSEELKKYFRLTAFDVRRIFQITISVYLLTSFIMLVYQLGEFCALQGFNLFSILLKCISSLLAFATLFRFFSAFTMMQSVKEVVLGRMTRSELFTFPIAQRRIIQVLIYTSLTIMIYGFFVSEVDLEAMESSDYIFLWGMIISWIIGGAIYGYCRFFIDKGRKYVESNGKIVS